MKTRKKQYTIHKVRITVPTESGNNGDGGVQVGGSASITMCPGVSMTYSCLRVGFFERVQEGVGWGPRVDGCVVVEGRGGVNKCTTLLAFLRRRSAEVLPVVQYNLLLLLLLMPTPCKTVLGLPRHPLPKALQCSGEPIADCLLGGGVQRIRGIGCRGIETKKKIYIEHPLQCLR